MVTIQVYSRSGGSPVRGAQVTVSVGWSGVCRAETDSSGEAHFPDVSPGQYEFYVNGQTFKDRLEGRKVVYI